MKTPVFLALFALTVASLPAQTFSTNVNVTSSDTANPNLKVEGNGGVLFKGSGSTTGAIPATGAGTRMMWYPAKGAFLAGSVTGAQWDNVGAASAAFGNDNQVPGQACFASGTGNNLGAGWCSATLGIYNTINDSSATVLVGQSNYVSSGYNSFAAGAWNSLSHGTSIALGESNTVVGWSAATIGRALTSASAGCVVVGMGNEPIIGDHNYWVSTDPVFIIGNGTANSAATGESGPVQSNALVVYKNGQIKIKESQGDILMGEFN